MALISHKGRWYAAGLVLVDVASAILLAWSTFGFDARAAWREGLAVRYAPEVSLLDVLATGGLCTRKHRAGVSRRGEGGGTSRYNPLDQVPSSFTASQHHCH